MLTVFLYVAVAFARLFFPAEAKLAMEIADASLSSANAGLSASKSMGSSGNLRDVDLNETHTVWTKRLQLQLQKLHKTGIIYFKSYWCLIKTSRNVCLGPVLT